MRSGSDGTRSFLRRASSTEAVIQAIRWSTWWETASSTPDRHYAPSEGVALADHLSAVHRNVETILREPPQGEYLEVLHAALAALGLDLEFLRNILVPVALLHDIGKPSEDKAAEIPHPLTGKSVKKRHPIVGVMAAQEIIPEDWPNRHEIMALVEEHDTPYAWYVQHQRTSQTPGPKSWAKLDRNIHPTSDGDPTSDGRGVVMLALFKLADIDGHTNVDDVPWFFTEANRNYLESTGKWLPVPSADVVRRIATEVGS